MDRVLKIMDSLTHIAVLQARVPIGGHNHFVEHGLSHQRSFGLARCDLTAAAGDAQAFNRYRNQNRHKNQRGQHFRQREAAATVAAASPLSASAISYLRAIAIHNSSGLAKAPT